MVMEAVLLGAGQRGIECVGRYALEHPEELKFIAVAEPNEDRRNAFARQHHIARDLCFEHYQPLFEKGRIAPLCFNTTMDAQHLDSSLKAMQLGYHLFLEKPLADSLEGGVQIVREALERKTFIQICHPLRYTPFYQQLKKLLDQGIIGRPLSFDMEERVGYWHFAHSFVRGNWGNSSSSGPLIVTKCCHDMDLACWLIGQRPKAVSSFGALSVFKPENAPEGAPLYCLDGCPASEECLYHAGDIYLGEKTGWPVSAISIDSGIEARRKALKEGPYGRCVYHCGNDVVDHQVVSVEFENEVTLNFAVRAHTCDFNRTIKVFGTAGQLSGNLEDSEIRVKKFEQGLPTHQQAPTVFQIDTVQGGHNGGDTGVIRNFLTCCETKDYESLRVSLENALAGHLLAFMADRARKSEAVLQLKEVARI
jgi:predicted dehydrogenase